MTDKKSLEAPCGIHCGLCRLNQALHNEAVRQAIEKVNLSTCEGCRAVDGHCPVIAEQCATWVCAQNKGVDFCCECAEFPCDKLAPSSDRADKLPHNIKVYSLTLRKAVGAHEWSKRIGRIYDLYYKGKMAIGRGPQLPQ